MIEKAKRVRIVLNTQLILSHPQKIFFRFHTESLHCMHCTGRNPFKSEMCGKQFSITGHLTAHTGDKSKRFKITLRMFKTR